MRSLKRLGVTLAATMLVALAIGPGTALALDENHGIGVNKGCIGQTKIGDQYRCSYAITNNQDEAHDTLTITSLVDTVNRPGSPNSGNILQVPGIGSIVTFEQLLGNTTTNASCTGLGTPAAICTLPDLTRIRIGGTGGTPGFSFYTVVAGDFNVNPVTHRLTDTAVLTWQDLCTSGTNNCPEGDQSSSTGSSTLVVKLTSQTATDIHNAAHQTVTAVAAGSIVHDFVTVTGEPGKPTPTGNVSIDWFLNGDCTGNPAANSGSIGPLAANGTFDATGFAFGPLATGHYAFRAHYLGDPTYNPSDGACEPLLVTNARISIAPDATNEVGHAHSFVVTLEKDTGTGTFVAAPGEHVDVTLTDTNGATHTPVAGTGTCTAAGPNTDAAGQCTITFNSATPGKVTGHATATLVVGGVTFTVQTNGTPPNSADAVKTYVDANIQITPETANNPVSTNHPLVGHVNVNDGQGGGFVNAPAGTLITFSLTNSGGATASFVGPNTCTTVGSTGSCQVVISSSTSGTTTVKASTSVVVGGVTLVRATGDGKLGDSVDANKTWSDDTVRTDIHDPAHTVITTAVPGDVVHDKVFVAKAAGTTAGIPDPTGTVVFHRYATRDCTGSPVDEPKTLAADGTAESSDFTVTGDMSYKAHYNGDANYPAHDGACEPLPVTTTLPCPAGTFAFSMDAQGNLNIKYDQFPAPNDNSYGVNAVGWGTKGHTFGNLVGSDHAGIQLKDANGVVRLSFNIDTISQDATAPSGYRSLGVTGGEGKVLVGTADGITADHSISRNLNNTGYFAGGVQVVGKPGTAGCPAAFASGCTDLLVNSPETLNTVDSYALTPNAAAVFNAPNTDSADSPGWNFHNTFFATISAAKLAALGFDINTWKVEPNEDELHNSPAKPCPCPTGATDPNPTITVHDNGNGTTTITYAQSLAVNDNSYGTGTDPSWGGKSHTFSNLTGSDKAQFVITNGNGATVYDFTLDYLSAKVGAPSGYGSLGPTGGDGSISTGTVGPTGVISWTTSLDDNMNIACAPPAGPWTTNSPTSPGAAECPAWNFVNSYTVTVSNAAFGASGLGGVTVPAVHNSPAKPNVCPSTGGGGSCNLAVTKTEVKDKSVKVTIKNNGSTEVFLTALNNIKWPAANGKLLEIKLDGDSIYKPAGGVPQASSPISLTTADFKGDQNKRKFKKNEDRKLEFKFENNASTTLSNYSGATADFGANCTVSILP